MLFLAEEEGIA